MKIALAFLALVLSSIAASAEGETPERLATLSGNMREAFERARFLCLAEGFPTVTYDVHHADLIPVQDQLKAKYPQYWSYGAAQGIAEVNKLWAEPFKRETVCEIFRNEGKNRK